MALGWEQTVIDAAAPVGQGAESWVVLTDPEGNEFCVLAARRGDAT